MDARLQRRVQRQGWDLAAPAYERLWQAQLSIAQHELLWQAALQPGERVLDVACGTGLVSFAAARAVGPAGGVVGVDLSGRMVEAARQRGEGTALTNVRFERMGAEQLALDDAGFDVVLCALGFMYMPDPAEAMREMRRVLRPGGRVAAAVWGERRRCGWAALFPIVDAEVVSDVCPLFFQLGEGDALASLVSSAGFEAVASHRIAATLSYADEAEACDAAFAGGPAALAWSRFDDAVRDRVRRNYVESIAGWQHGAGFRMPGEFVIVVGQAASVP